jgi:hypothetical protein
MKGRDQYLSRADTGNRLNSINWPKDGRLFSYPATFASRHERLMVRVWALNLNIEFYETIKQWCFSV